VRGSGEGNSSNVSRLTFHGFKRRIPQQQGGNKAKLLVQQKPFAMVVS
jgi:hypothetical protein